MGTETMGGCTVAAKIENVAELYLVSETRHSRDDQVHRVEVERCPGRYRGDDALDAEVADRATGSHSSPVPTALTSAGTATFNVFGAVRLTVQGRECTIDVAEIPDGCPVLIGQVPLELLDIVVDPK